MRSIMFSAMLAAAMLVSCNSENKPDEHEAHDAPAATQHVTPEKAETKLVTVVYKDVDAGVSASIRAIVDQYLAVKNAFAADKGADAAAAAKALVEAANKLDKSLLTADQKKAYDAVENALKDHAGQIAGKTADINAQRNHFDELSNAVYEMVKNFGAGRTVYHDHCPMANDNQGALWISENKEIANPYFGAAMLTCGTVEEEIR